MVKLLKIKRRDFSQWDSIPRILVSRIVKTPNFKLPYFRNETCFAAGNLYKDLFSIYLRPSVKKEFVKPRFFVFASWWRHCENHRCSEKRKWRTDHVSLSPNDGAPGAPFLINEGRVGHFKTKNLENRLKPKILFLREDFSPLFGPKK